jgi:ABC-type xylose transport system substrate-binding protein
VLDSEICVEQCRHAIFLSLLEYLYTGTDATARTQHTQMHVLSDYVRLHADTAVELYMAADRFNVGRLKALCESAVVNGIKDDNATSLLQV